LFFSFSKTQIFSLLVRFFGGIAHNGLALGEEADFEALHCLPAQKLIRGRMFN